MAQDNTATAKSIFYCRSCGNESLKWQGKCSFCGEWNSLVEKKIIPSSKKGNKISALLPSSIDKPILLQEIEWTENDRIVFVDPEFNRVAGGGLMKGSISLVAGEPGIGKSTLLLQLGLRQPFLKTLYISGEESLQQLKDRALRLGIKHNSFYFYTHTNIERIIEETEEIKPDWIIVDSIQTVSTSYIDAGAGSMVQLRESAVRLQRLAKTLNIPIVLVGHITKEGSIAGPKILEHIVDTVILFEGERNYSYRMLRATKNRFGSAMEIGIYEMQKQGLKPVLNPSEILLTQRSKDISGASVGCINEGLRSMFVETQALVAPTYYGTPQRTANGVEHRKLQLVSAILEKRCHIQLNNKDIFLTLVGGIKTDDPSIDLSIAVSIVSSFFDIPIPSHFCFAGELALSGEIRSVARIEQRISEAEKSGFHTFVCSSYNFKEPLAKKGIRIFTLQDLSDLIKLLKKE